MLTIAKRAEAPHAFKRVMIPFRNARNAFQAYLQAIGIKPTEVVLLPAFVGWSPKEGSGIFDPIQSAGAQYDFYGMTRRLEIDLEDFRCKLARTQPRIVVLVHYFGFPDRSYPEAVRLAQAAGAQVLEDEAHALYSDLVGGVCGRLGETAIFSLHKMLPPVRGGMLVLNHEGVAGMQFPGAESPNGMERALFEYDLFEISRARRRNANELLELLKPLAGRVEPMYANLPEGVVPQTLPVLIHTTNRDRLYSEMNVRGFGVVTLYHTLIEPIAKELYPESHWLSQRILNLPAHQDVAPGALEMMVKALGQLT